MDETIDKRNDSLMQQGIVFQSVKAKKINKKCTIVEWKIYWSNYRSKAFKKLHKTLTMDYQKKWAIVRKVIKEAKKEAWGQFCSTIGRETTLDKMWMMVKKMTGKYKLSQIPVLVDGRNHAVSNADKSNVR